MSKFLQQFRRVVVASVLALGVVATSVSAFTPFQIEDIEVEGLQRIDVGVVFANLPVRIGEVMTGEKAADTIRLLFATGLFRDVRVETENKKLIVLVEERQTISYIEFAGIQTSDSNRIKQALKEIGFSIARPFDKTRLIRAETSLKEHFLSLGKYGVEIVTTVTPLANNQVGVHFDITEGDDARIADIRFIGAQAISESELLDEIKLTPSNWLSWYTKNDQYSRRLLESDLETVRSYYLNRGYVDFGIDSKQVSVSPDLRDIFIVIGLSEGAQYQLGNIKLSGVFILPEEEIRQMVTLKSGQPYGLGDIEQVANKIKSRLGRHGYAYATVRPIPQIKRAEKTVDLTLVVDPGKRVYVRRIAIKGNSRTLDEVVRRELRQFESAWYDEEKVRLSERRVQRLGFFDQVELKTKAIPGNLDQVDLEMRVKEAATGSISMGLGYSRDERASLSASIKQDNLFGSGNSVGLTLNTGEINSGVSASFTKPYLIDSTNLALNLNLSLRKYDPRTLNVGDYRTENASLNVGLSYPLSEVERLSFSSGYEAIELQTFDNSPFRYREFVRAFGNENDYYPIYAAYTYHAVDNFITPSEGLYARVFGEVSPSGNIQYEKTGVEFQKFFKLSNHGHALMIGVNNTTIKSKNEENGVPFFKRLYAGGIGSVRGYRTSSLGPRAIVCDDDGTNCSVQDGLAAGGTQAVTGSLEYLFPMPGSKGDQRIRLSLFVDAGQVFDETQKFDASLMRYSYGLALNWRSPIGPLKLSYGLPVSKKYDYDRYERFQFQVGTFF